MPATLFLSGVAASFGARPLFSGLDATIAPGDVTALVGANGAGKTTLLRIIAGEHAPDAGTVRFAQAEFEDAAAALASGEPAADDRYARALDHWLALGGADIEVRLAEVLARLELDVAPDRPLGTLSGGQAARAGLASILVSRYDLLLLDEPTNNLDAAGLEAIMAFVAGLASPVLVASHDRAFLDAVATSVLELDEAQQAVNHYTGGWTEYRAAKALARAQAVEAYEAYAGKRSELVEQARRKTEWASQGRAKAARLGPGMKLEKKFREDRARRMDQRAARVRDAVERLEEVEQPRREWELRYSIAEAAPSADVVLALDGVVARAGDFRVGPVSAQVVRGDRVALVGANGSGKTTLLEALLGVRPVEAGRVSWGTRTSIGTIDQGRSVVSGPRSLLEEVAAALDETELASVRTLLAKFGLGPEHVGRPCDSLSLGERTRAALAVLQGRAVNVLVLDEPTNHLDAAAIEQLEAALTAFGGTLLIVTHDRTLLDALTPTAIWEFTRPGTLAEGRVAVRDPVRHTDP